MKFLVVFIFSCLLFINKANAWKLFGPSDFEECAVSAAEDAKSNQALTLLIQNCNNEFPARKKSNGKYYYFNERTNSSIEVESPRLSSNDRKRIEDLNKKANQIEEENRTLTRKFQEEHQAKIIETINNLKILDWNFECSKITSTCYVENIHIRVQNRSKNEIIGIGFGFVLVPNSFSCDNNLAQNMFKNIKIPSSQSAVLNFSRFEITDSPKADYEKLRGCIAITTIEILG